MQVGEQAVAAAARGQPRHTARGVVQIAHRDRPRRTALLARGLRVAVAHRASLGLRLRLALLDALDAHRALLHHAAAAHHDVGVEHQVGGRILVRVVEPVEPPRLERAVVGAVARADAAVVDLLAEALARVHRRQHRAHRLAGRVLAVLAHHRLVHDARRVGRAGVVAVDADPVHLAAPAHLVGADRGHVVLGLARDDAGGAARARVEIDRHRPAVTGVAVDRPHRVLGLGGRPGRVGVGAQAGGVDLAHERPPLHRVVRLRARQRQAPARRPDRNLARRRANRSQRERVGADAVADGAGRRPAVAERHGHHARMHARLHQHRELHGARPDRHRDLVAVVKAQARRRRRRDRRRVAPRGLGDRVGQLVQPAVVAERAAQQPDGRVERKLQATARAARRVRRQHLGHALGPVGRRDRLACDLGHAVLHRPVPERLERSRRGAREDLRLPARAHEVVERLLHARPAQQRLGPRACVVERRHGGLPERQETAARLGVAPRLQGVVIGREVDGARGGLVAPVGHRHGQRHVAEEPAQRLAVGMVVDGVHAGEDDRADRARAQLLDQRGHRPALGPRHRIVERQRVTVVAQRLVDGVDQRLCAGVGAAAHEQAGAAGAVELAGEAIERLARGLRRRRGHGRGAELAGEVRQHRRHVRRQNRQALVGVGSGEREPVLELDVARHRLEARPPRSRALAVADRAGLGVRARERDRRDPRAQEVGVDAHDQARAVEAVRRHGRHAVRRGVRVRYRVGRERVVAHARGRRVGAKEAPDRRLLGGAHARGRDQADRPALGREPRERAADRRVLRGPRRLAAAGGGTPGARGVVEREHGGLPGRADAAPGQRVQRIALDLDGAPVARLDQQPAGRGARAAGGRVEGRHARRHLLGLDQVRDDLLDGRAAARGGHGRGRQAHHPEEVAARVGAIGIFHQ